MEIDEIKNKLEDSVIPDALIEGLTPLLKNMFKAKDLEYSSETVRAFEMGIMFVSHGLEREGRKDIPEECMLMALATSKIVRKLDESKKEK